MAIKQIQQDNLFKAFGLFIEAFRPYVVSVLQTEAGDKWPAWFVESLYPVQRDNWNNGLRAGSAPEALIDYPYLKGFSLKYKDLLKTDFNRDTNKLASRLETISETRNKLAHFQPISEDEFAETFIHMKSIARSLQMDELELELASLHSTITDKPLPKQTKKPLLQNTTEPWFRVVTPHLDIRQGRLDESVFAANLAEVSLGHGREIYNNPVVFFSKTYLTAGLKNVARTVIKGLNGNEDAENRVISLQTGFGGGKTHTLISLFHLASWGRKAAQSPFAAELLQATGSINFDKANIAVFTNTTNDPAQGRQVDGTTIRTIWGELAWQLGGADAYQLIKKNDEDRSAPKGLFKKILEKCKPALILIDELADYCVSASAQTIGASNLSDQTISFMQELTEAVAATNNCVMVVTLPASPQEVGNTSQAHTILNSLQKRVSRVGADTQPVADDEIYEVIRRRLFEEVGDPETINQVVTEYTNMYKSHLGELPSNANKLEYKEKLLKSYPFHPELIDVFRIRWASHHDFQRTRGVLRLLATIVSDLWKRQQNLAGSNQLIQAGMVNFVNLDALSAQLKKLYGNGYDSVITADVAGSSSNAFKIDTNKAEYGQWSLTQSIASVILMNSFGSDGTNKGVSVADIKLNLLSPHGYNHNSINGALDELESSAYYLYQTQSGASSKRYWFHTKPNINILINQAKGIVNQTDITSEILDRASKRTNYVSQFNVLVNPSEDIPEQKRPTIIMLSPDNLANPDGVNGRTLPLITRIATKKGNSERIYRNTILFLLCSELGIGRLQSELREYLACLKINQDYQGQLETEQKQELKRRIDESNRQANTALVKAYSIVVKYAAKNGPEKLILKEFSESIENQININLVSLLKEEEWLLSEGIGLNTLRMHNLLPTVDNAIKVKDIYEAFLRFDDKPMISGTNAITTSLLRYCNDGHFCIASGDGTNFTRYYCKESVPHFDITDDVYWLVHLDNKPIATATPLNLEVIPGTDNPQSPAPPLVAENKGELSADNIKRFHAITISGKVPLENYTELFNYFIAPFAMSGSKIEIDVKFRIKSTPSNTLDETKQQYKSAKESARQLGLSFEEE